MDEFARLPTKEQRPYFEVVAARSGLGEHIVEKDFWVCWVLKRLFELPTLRDQIIFKGGTSLSKVFSVIDRFSEDVDLSVSKELLGFGGDLDPEKATSSKQRSKRIEELASTCAEFVATTLKRELLDSIQLALGGEKGEWSEILAALQRFEQEFNI